MTVSGELCCVALPFCCVVVALPFSTSLEVIVRVSLLFTADTENNLSEDDGWEFVTLADQVIVT